MSLLDKLERDTLNTPEGSNHKKETRCWPVNECAFLQQATGSLLERKGLNLLEHPERRQVKFLLRDSRGSNHTVIRDKR